MNFLQRTPFFRLLLPLVCGIMTSEHLVLFPVTLLLLLFTALLMIVLPALLQSQNAYHYRWRFGAGMMLLLFVAGYALASHKAQATAFPVSGKATIYRVLLTDTPAEKSASVVCRATILHAIENQIHSGQTGKIVLLYLHKDSVALALQQGDVLLIQAEFKRPPGVVNPRGFDYATFLRRKGVGATAFVGQGRWELTGNQAPFSLKRVAEQSRTSLLRYYERLELSNEAYAIVAALTLGYKDAIDPELRERFSHSGAMHILAVSGLHVGVIWLILQMGLSFVFRGRKFLLLNTVLIVSFLWVYAFITGLPPSVIRSAAMFSLVAVGKALDRRAQIYNTIAVSAFFILLSDPDYIFDIGFQLSYTAVLGIIYFQPIFAKLLKVKNKLLHWWWELTAVSMAAQLATLPLVLFYFQQFPNYFLLTNYVAIPLATLIIYAAVFYLSLSWIPILSLLTGFLLKGLLTALHQSIVWISSLPSAISSWSIEGWQMFFMVSALISIVFYLGVRTYWTLILLLGSILAFMVVEIAQHYRQLNTQKLIVYADSRHTHVDIITGKASRILTTNSIAAQRLTQPYHRSRRLSVTNIVELKGSEYITFGRTTALLLLDDALYRRQTSHPLQVDVLLIGHGVRPRAETLLECVSPGIIIIPSSLRGWYADELKRVAEELGVECHVIAERGAYVSKLNK